MARQEIILGTPPLGLGGDTPRVASSKINAMTSEVYEKLSTLVKVTTPTDSTEGRLVTPGFMGIGGNSISAPNGEIDNLSKCGFYWTAGSTTSPEPYGHLFHHQVDPTTCVQTFTSYYGGAQQWFRTRPSTAAWSAWAKVYNTANTTRAADGTLKAI